MKAAKIITLLSVAFLCLCLGLTALEVGEETIRTEKAVQSACNEAQARIKDTSQNLNAILIQVGLAADQMNQASNEQRLYWQQISRKTTRLLDTTNAAVLQFQATTAQSGQDIHQVSQSTAEALAHVGPVLDETRKTVESVNKAVSDQNIGKTMANVEKTTDEVAKSAANIQKATEDLKGYVHQKTHPSTASKIWGGFLSALKVLLLVR